MWLPGVCINDLLAEVAVCDFGAGVAGCGVAEDPCSISSCRKHALLTVQQMSSFAARSNKTASMLSLLAEIVHGVFKGTINCAIPTTALFIYTFVACRAACVVPALAKVYLSYSTVDCEGKEEHKRTCDVAG
ncbi:hypothetical protein M8C21_018910, partial [Ambrosia artemisiifolia]